MASVTYTYDDFTNALNASGLAGQFSSADLKLAQTNPNAGMSILQSKIDYRNATTDEARALANANAESVRSSYGLYTGGSDGSGYTLNPLSPASYTAPTYSSQYSSLLSDALNSQLNYGTYSYNVAEPTYTNQYENTLKQLLDDQLNYADFTYSQERPTYTSRYEDRINEAINNLTQNQKEFSYDPASDSLYQNYKKQYTREGKRAMEDALGLSAANTGGLASSYATAAAAQAGNYYNAQMTDKIPELYQIAYNRYLNELQQQQNALQILQDAEQTDYSRYQDLNSIYDTDRNFAYNVYTDKYNRINNNLDTVNELEQNDYNKYLNQLSQYNTNRDFDYNTWLDQYNILSNNTNTLSGLEQNDYARYQDQRNFDYNQLLDEINQQTTIRQENTAIDQFNKEYQLALKENDYDTAYKVAAALASAGDTSYLYDLKKLLSGA